MLASFGAAFTFPATLLLSLPPVPSPPPGRQWDAKAGETVKVTMALLFFALRLLLGLSFTISRVIKLNDPIAGDARWQLVKRVGKPTQATAW